MGIFLTLSLVFVATCMLFISLCFIFIVIKLFGIELNGGSTTPLPELPFLKKNPNTYDKIERTVAMNQRVPLETFTPQKNKPLSVKFTDSGETITTDKITPLKTTKSNG